MSRYATSKHVIIMKPSGCEPDGEWREGWGEGGDEGVESWGGGVCAGACGRKRVQ